MFSSISWMYLVVPGLLLTKVQGIPPEADPGPQPSPLQAQPGFPQGFALPDGITPDNFAKFLDESGRSLPNLPGNDVCGNQDFLTNMLVYQYLSGSIPGNGNIPTPVTTPTFTPTTTTETSLSTSLTTLVKTLEASTHFSTSTTSYVTTITSVDTKVVPLIFRGSKVISTITESSTEVITATEFFTSTSVLTPSIVQTLPVEITLSITRTKGTDGEFTAADISRGASTVLDQPIQTVNPFDLGIAGGLDVSNLDLGGLDLTSLSSLVNSQGNSANDQADLIAQLTALLGGEDPAPADEDYYDTGFRYQEQPKRSKFQPPSSPRAPSPFRHHPQAPRTQAQKEDEAPFKVLQGGILRDRAPAPPRNTKSGAAIHNTRFSKFHKRPSTSENAQKERDPPADRERQRFSGSERRQTFRRAKSTRSSRRVHDTPAFENSHEPHPELQSSALRSGVLRPRKPASNSPIVPARASSNSPIVAPKRPPTPEPKVEIPQITPGKTTKIFTMYLSGSNGDTITTLRTVTLRNRPTRFRREATDIAENTEIIDATSTYQAPTETQKPSLTKAPSPKEVLSMLKGLDSKSVKQMLKSLQKWVNYYSDELLESKEDSVLTLKSSLQAAPTESDNTATVALPVSSTVAQSTASSNMLCPAPSIVTETVYHTITYSKEN